MAWTQGDLDRLEKAIGSGATRIRFKDHDTELRSLDDMMRIRTEMKKELNGHSESSDSSVSFAEYSDGK